MVRKDNGRPIFQGSVPNDFALQAVKLIYPDSASFPDPPAAVNSDIEMEDVTIGLDEGDDNERVSESK